MKKCLKLADPFTKTFPNLTHILAIIQDIPSAKLWYINNFIQIQVNEDVLNARIYQFPTSAIKLDGRRINYYDFLMSAEEPECNTAIQRMVPKINLEQIERFIEEVPSITELQKTFYKRYITARFEQILKPAYDMVMSEKQELPESKMTM